MYKKFFGLCENPFSVNPDPRFLCETPETQEALACLTYGIHSRKGFVLLTGEVGTGKTTLLNKLVDRLRGAQVVTAFIFNPRLEVNEFLHFVLTEFGIPCEPGRKSQMLIQLNQWLLERYRSGETAAIIVDEAQNLSHEVLEELRLLTNLETSTDKLLQIVLSGQPELEFKLKQPELRQLRQRITLRCRTFALTLDQTRKYIQERLRIAGADGQPVVSSEALDAVHRHSGGIPRVVNLLCDHALIAAFAEEERPVTVRTVEGVAREFDLDRGPVVFSDSFRAEPGSRGSPSINSSLQVLSTLMDHVRRPE
jgi:general secretion pathway protein A